jgi:ferredoxin--NADP+ reductase
MSEINTKPTYTAKEYDCKVTNISHLTDSTFLLTFEKPNFEFASGQHVIVSLPRDLYDREYSICSAEEDLYLQIIVKEVKNGYFSPLLKKVKVGDVLKIRGPHGRFCLDYISIQERPIIMIATGTGIAPFRSMYKSYPNLKFRIIHGVKNSQEAYFIDEFKEAYVLCTSQEKKSNSFHGRVTEYIQDINFDPNSIFYLCGNFNMIYDVQSILTSKGHSLNSIFTEVYF